MSIPDEPTGEAVVTDAIFPEQDELETHLRQPMSAKAVALVGARAAIGLVGIAVAGATIAASALLPIPTLTSTAPNQRVIPVPTAQQLVCPGAILRLADESGADATVVSAIGRPAVTSDASAGQVDSTPVEISDADSGRTTAAPIIISTPPLDSTDRVLLSGAQAEQAASGDFVGLAAADCAVAGSDTWLAGGSTIVGRTTLLTLANPSEVPATVSIELFGENGAIAAPGTNGIIVPASGQRVLSLAGFAPGVVSPVVHVTSTGGQVLASLQHSVVRGLQPGGVDVVESTGLSLDSIIPGVRVTNAEAVEALSGGGESFADTLAVLRVFAPGNGDVSLTVSLIPEDGAETGDSFALDIDAGRVSDVPIGELATGNYTVRVESKVPVLSSVRVTSAAGESTDFAWFVPSPMLTERAQVTVADGPSPMVHLENPTSTDAEVVVTPLDGSSPTSVVVPAGASALVDVDARRGYDLSGFDELYAAVSLAGDGMVARYGIDPPGAGSSPLLVYR